MKIVYDGISNIGLRRKINQDSIMMYSSDEKDFHLFVVADGMGGHSDGEKASQEIAKAMLVWAKEMQVEDYDSDFSKIVAAAKKRLEMANYFIYRKYNQNQVCGSTAVILLFYQDNYSLITVGDSRVFLNENHIIRQISEDDVWEKQPLVLQALTEQQIQRNFNFGSLVNSVGTEEILEMKVSTNQAKAGNVFLMCSDGLYKFCEESYVEEMMKRAETEELMPLIDDMLSVVYENGAGDNVSIILIRVEE